LEKVMRIAGALAGRNARRKTEARCRDDNRLEQRAQRYLTRMTVEVVHAIRPRVMAEDDNAVGFFNRKSPGLRVVAARRPARQFENFDERHHQPERFTMRPVWWYTALCRRPARSSPYAELTPRDCDRGALNRIAIAPGTPRARQLASVRVEVNDHRRRVHLAALQHDLQRFRRRH